jgi:CRP/FNR family transcriptional regulator, cyclic AMP receptor protein
MKFFDYSSDDDDAASSVLTVLSDLTDDDWKALVKYAQNIHFRTGDMLLNAGESDDGVYILVSGRVEVIGKGSFGADKSIAEIDEGSVFGELAFFDQQPRSAGIRAISDGDVLHLTHAGFDQLAAWNPVLARQLLFDLGRVLAYRFRRATASSI